MSQKPESKFKAFIRRKSRPVSGGVWAVFNIGLAVVEGVSKDSIAAGASAGLFSASVANLAFGEKAERFSGPISLVAYAGFMATGAIHKDIGSFGFGLGGTIGTLELYYKNSAVSRLMTRLTNLSSGDAVAWAYNGANIPLLYKVGTLIQEGLRHHKPAKLEEGVALAVVSAGFISGNIISGMAPPSEPKLKMRRPSRAPGLRILELG